VSYLILDKYIINYLLFKNKNIFFMEYKVDFLEDIVL
jgi:hypothetical protein